MRIDRSRSRSPMRDESGKQRRRGDEGGQQRGRGVELRSARRPARSASPGGRLMVKVGNLPSGIQWQDLKDAFGSASIDRADVDGQVGFLKFKDSQDAERAIREYDGGVLNGNKIYVRYA